VAEEALEGLKGVELVNSNFRNSMETNIVWYDPALTGVDQMEKALKDAGTYLGTAK
jgi:copper chaperone CopZ